jgi:hypothetical protein
MGGAPWTVFLVYLMIAIIASVVRFFIASSLIQLSGWDFFTHALSRCLLVLILSCITPLLMISLLGSGIVAGLLTFAMTLIATCLISFLVGLNKEERTVILARVVKKFNKVQ